MTEEESWRHRNSKILINADCLSNSNIPAEGASSQVWRDFTFADNPNYFLLFCSWENKYSKLCSLGVPFHVLNLVCLLLGFFIIFPPMIKPLLHHIVFYGEWIEQKSWDASRRTQKLRPTPLQSGVGLNFCRGTGNFVGGFWLRV